MRGALPLARLVAIVLVSVVGGLMFWASLPMALGWSSHAILSGSMTPRIAVGDVLMSAPVPPAQLRTGMVVLFHDPEDPRRVLAHRIRSITGDGWLVTCGDANAVDDRDPVRPDAVVGVARIRVPLVGMPRSWMVEGRYGPLVLLFAIVGTAVFLARRPGEVRSPGASDDAGPVPLDRPGLPARCTA